MTGAYLTSIPAIGNITGLGTGVATALAINTGTTGAFPVQTSAVWTPIDSSGAALTFTGVNASYTRIGNMIFAYAALTFPATGSTAAITIGGLPVTVPNQTYAIIPQPVTQGGTLAFPLITTPVRNSTTVNFNNQFTQAGVQNVTLSGQTVFFMTVYPAS